LVEGLGQASLFTQLPWVVEQCRRKLGFEPYPGTVNLQVLAQDRHLWDQSKEGPGITLSPPDGSSCDATCYPVTIDERLAAAIILPHVEGYPGDKLELLSPHAVVRTLSLLSGQVLSVRFDEDAR